MTVASTLSLLDIPAEKLDTVRDFLLERAALQREVDELQGRIERLEREIERALRQRGSGRRPGAGPRHRLEEQRVLPLKGAGARVRGPARAVSAKAPAAGPKGASRRALVEAPRGRGRPLSDLSQTVLETLRASREPLGVQAVCDNVVRKHGVDGRAAVRMRAAVRTFLYRSNETRKVGRGRFTTR